ncbi:ImmA/IrrE family metallo-endopeptidase [Rhizobium laguerreae]|uniref:ImmA/IrrE family metallo-endopeptidase n=1 Tax=Rhizobium laguerreae TaxID=1076926 RepID=UPI001C91335B|nr:ImmA/IrrE family metallo-endopeptidase [Rhizobium laguerreae]MBY3413134.1 ImmA/IrrE family metallo-endopeptidase [Rhizobium laguerreae]
MATRKAIEEEASALLSRVGFDSAGPVDPVAVANELGLKVFNATFDDEGIHGLIAKRPSNTSIFVNVNDKPVRKRFTVAHELGHFVLHLAAGEGEFIDTQDNFRTVQDPDTPWDDKRRSEWEANVFAAALLMPPEAVHRAWKEIGDPEGMAAYFQVSRQAMALRLDSLGLLE